MDYIIKSIQTGEKDYNTKMVIEFSDICKINNWWDSYTNTRNIKNRVLDSEFELLLKDLYLSGYGFKMIASSIPKASYTKIRGLFNEFFPELLRYGKDTVTDSLKNRRSERLLQSKDNPWKVDLDNKNSTGIQGRYTSSTGETCWLRSSYEYIYVKWMEKHGIEFKSEPTKFKLSNGQFYTPDFAIYKDGKLINYVETKGKVFENNLHKPHMLASEIGKPVIIVDDISPYCEISYGVSLKEWKKYLMNTNQKVGRKGIKP